MQAIMYLMKRQYINKIKRAFSSVLSAIITVLGLLGISFTFVMAFTVKRPIVESIAAETIMAGVLLMIGVILYNSFLSRDSGILTMADANFLFTGPFEKRTVLAYLLISTAPASFLTGFFMCFYLPYLLGPALTVPKFLIVLIIISLLFGSIFLSYYYLYIVDADKSGIKKKVRKIFLAFLGVLGLVFLLLLINSGFNVKVAAQKFFTHTWYNWVPLFGWTKWAISSLLSGNIILGFIPATALLVLTNSVLCFALYNVKSDFYEKTLEDSVNLQKLMDEVKTNGSADARSIAKLKTKVASIRFMQGAAAIYSRQRLESNKLNLISKCREIFMGVFYVAFGAIFGLEFNFVLVMIGFGALSMSLNDSWHRDFKKPYVFLIPENSFKKVIFSVLPGIIKTVINASITITFGAIVFRINPGLTITYLIMFASFAILFVLAEVFTYRIIGTGSSALAVTFMRMFFAMATCIPAIIVIVVIAVISNDIPNIFTTAVCLFIINIASSAILAFLSRGIFEKTEIMD